MSDIFSPRSVAVIGASRDRGKVGWGILDNLKKNFKGRVFPINPKAGRILGLKCYSSISMVPGRVELAVIAIPARFVPQVLEECGRKRVKTVVVISAGFKESSIEGTKLENECLRIVKKHRMRMVGPNCLGIINTYSGLNATFASHMPGRGKIAMMSQSGALCSAILDWAKLEDVGFSKFVSLGNKADLSENEFLEMLNADGNTRVILGYLEDLKDGKTLMETSRSVSRKKPVIFMKSGRTSAGARAAASHTGALAGSDSAYDTAFEQCGIMRADSAEELFDYAIAFAEQPIPKGNGVAIVTNAGGPSIIATDACESYGLEITAFENNTIKKLRNFLPAASSIYNPVDMLGDADAERYKKTLETVVADRNVDCVIVLLTPQAMTNAKEIAEVVAGVSKKTGKPVLCSFMGGVDVSAGIRILKKNGIPNYPYPERAAKTMSAMVEYTKIKKRKYKKPEVFSVERDKVERIIRKAMVRGVVNLGFEAMEILKAYGIPTCRYKLVKNPEDALSFADAVGYPVALKIMSRDIVHKSDIGCVMVNVNRDEVVSAYNRILANAKRFAPKARIHGILVQEMITGGHEVILGSNRDPKLGDVMMFGMGGIYVEVLKDVRFKVAPMNRDEANDMVTGTKMYPVLRGMRGEKPADIKSVVDSLLRLSQLVTDFPEIVELDVNPLMVFPEGSGSCAIDARIILEGKK